MPLLEKPPAEPEFSETDWIAGQHRRGSVLFQWVAEWLLDKALAEPLATRIRLRALPWKSGVVEGPGTFMLCAAESLGLPATLQRQLGVAAELYWAAADVADDVDDGEEQCGFKPHANDGCAMLFLAVEALAELGPAAVSLGNQYGLRMAAGQARDLAATGRPSAFDVHAIARDKAGAEAAFFLALAAQAAGRQTQPFANLGEKLGVALQLFSDVADVYMAPHSLDLETGKHTVMLQAFARRNPRRAEFLLACRRDWPDVQAALRFEMREAALESLAGLDAAIWHAWAEAQPLLADAAALGSLVQWIIGLITVSRAALAELEEPAPVCLPSGPQVLARAKLYLAAGPFEERHRWGLFGADLVKGDLFTTVYVTAALRELGGDWQPGLQHILRLREHNGWRYYPGHTQIPLDADDTGLVIGHFHDALPGRVRDGAIEVLASGLHATGIHTWLTTGTSDIEWQGDDCLATLANAAWALVRTGQHSRIAPGVWERLLRSALDGACESPFYTTEATRYFVHRCLAFAAQERIIGRDAQEQLRQDTTAWYSAQRRWGGSTSDSLMATAFNALTALEWGLATPGDLPAYFAARQETDGSWPGEPLFMIPGVNYRPVRWGHPALTTSVVVTTLARLA